MRGVRHPPRSLAPALSEVGITRRAQEAGDRDDFSFYRVTLPAVWTMNSGSQQEQKLRGEIKGQGMAGEVSGIRSYVAPDR